MDDVKHIKSGRKKVIALMLLLCMVFSSYFYTPVEAKTTLKDVWNDMWEDDEDYGMTFSAVSKAFAKYSSDNLKPSKDENDRPGVELLQNVNAGNAGAFVGYASNSWLASLLSISSLPYSYVAFSKVPTGSGNNTSNAILKYCRYGYLLGDLGLDQTSTESSWNIAGLFAGNLTKFVYIMSNAVDLFFMLALDLLATFNPFNLFVKGHNAIFAQQSSLQMQGTGGVSTAFAGFEGIFTNYYTALYTFSWEILIPFFFLGLVLSFTLLRRAGKMGENRWGKVKRYLIRISFLMIGVPLLGGCYTAALDSIRDSISSGTPATRLLASTFVDFEAWASNGRLAVPTGMHLAYTTDSTGGEDLSSGYIGSADVKSVMGTRDLCYRINQLYSFTTDPGNASASYLVGTSPFPSADNAAATLSQWETTMSGDSSSDSLKASVKSRNAFSKMMNLLDRYIDGTFYTASDYESSVKGELQKIASANGSSGIRSLFSFNDEAYSTMNTELLVNPDLFDAGSIDVPNIYANGNMSMPDFATAGDSIKVTTGIGDGTLTSQYGLSTISLYNYLNTAFYKNGCITYSPEDSASGFVRRSHRSVVMVGTGIECMLFWFNAMVLMGCFVVLGFFYAFALIFANLKRSVKVITSMPMAMLGSLRGIAKMITYTFMLIVEIIGTLFMYSLMTELLMAIPNLIMTPMSGWFSGSGSFGAIIGKTAAGTILLPLSLILTIIFEIIFCIIAVRMRKQFVRSVDEALGQWVERLVGVNPDVSAGSPPGLGRMALGGVAAGVGAGIGSHMVNSALGSGNNSGQQNRSVQPNDSGGGSGGRDGNSGGRGGTGNQGNVGGRGQQGLPGPNGSGGGPGGQNGHSGGGRGIADGSVSKDDAADQKAKDTAASLGDSLGGKKEAEKQTKEEAKDVKTKAQMDSAIGTGKSNAAKEEVDAEKRKQLEKQNKKDAEREVAAGAVNTAAGVAKGAVSADTGNAAGVADGARQAVDGLKAVKEGHDGIKHADENAALEVQKQRDAENAREAGEKQSIEGGKNDGGSFDEPAGAMSDNSSDSVRGPEVSDSGPGNADTSLDSDGYSSGSGGGGTTEYDQSPAEEGVSVESSRGPEVMDASYGSPVNVETPARGNASTANTDSGQYDVSPRRNVGGGGRQTNSSLPHNTGTNTGTGRNGGDSGENRSHHTSGGSGSKNTDRVERRARSMNSNGDPGRPRKTETTRPSAPKPKNVNPKGGGRRPVPDRPKQTNYAEFASQSEQRGEELHKIREATVKTLKDKASSGSNMI